MTRRDFVRAGALFLPVAYACGTTTIIPGPLARHSSQSISPAAAAALADWVTRVQGVSSDVTIAGTQTAVGKFIDGLMTDGVWSKIFRINIYAGDGLNALKAPLKNGGAWNTQDVLNNFVSGDYSQSTGLTGDTVNKYVTSGLFCNESPMGDNDVHLACYQRTTPDTHTAISVIGTGGLTSLGLYSVSGNSYFDCNNYTTTEISVADAGIGMYIGSRTSTSSSVLYKNGSSIGTNGVAGGTRPDARLFVHCQNLFSTPQSFTARTIEMYSIGTGLTATEAANFSSRYATLRTALGR